MYKDGDILEVDNPKGIHGGFTKLKFTEDAHCINGNPYKYMGMARAVCDDYEEASKREKENFCGNCRHRCAARRYMVKYVGPFGGAGDSGAEPLKENKRTVTGKESPDSGKAMVNRPKILERKKQTGGRARNAATNAVWDTVTIDEPVDKKAEVCHVDRTDLQNKRVNGGTRQEDVGEDCRQKDTTGYSNLELERSLLANQAASELTSPFLMQTILSGQAVCHGTAVDYVVLEYAGGQGLKHYIAVLKNMEGQDPEEADRRRMDLIRQLLYAVRAYSVQRLGSYSLHRDLKPENICVQVEIYEGIAAHKLKLLDFDMMIDPDNINIKDLKLGGTKGYAHPDAWPNAVPDGGSRKFSHRWDLYAVGLIIYEIMEGHPHFEDDAYLQDEKLAYTLKPMEKGKRYPELVKIIEKLINEKEQHYDDIGEVIEDYQQFLEKENPNWYWDYYMDQWLECRSGYEQSQVGIKVFCRVSVPELKDCWQNFCVYNYTVTPLVLGKNVFCADYTGGHAQQKELGVFFCTDGRSKGELRLRYMPVNGKYWDKEGCQKDEQTDVLPGDYIQYMNMKIYVERIEYI